MTDPIATIYKSDESAIIEHTTGGEVSLLYDREITIPLRGGVMLRANLYRP